MKESFSRKSSNNFNHSKNKGHQITIRTLGSCNNIFNHITEFAPAVKLIIINATSLKPKKKEKNQSGSITGKSRRSVERGKRTFHPFQKQNAAKGINYEIHKEITITRRSRLK